MKNKSLKEALGQLLAILRLEKEALIHNHGEKIEKIISEKEKIVSVFESFDLDKNDQEDKEIISLIQEIKELQETNLLLTRQAMNYATTFISAFQKEANKDLTYSKKDNDGSNTKSSILNQSL